jgi:uncharacterized protein (TIGR02147 family)
MSLFGFEDYRVFLRNYIRNLPRNGRGEINRIASRLRVHSSFISQILSGAKDLNMEQAHELTGYLGLNSLEADYFLLLVQSARAGSRPLREYLKSKLAEIKNQSLEVTRRIPQDRMLTDSEKSVFYSSWIYLAVWLFTSVAKGQTLEAIVGRFEISRSRAREILQFLVGVGLCKDDDGQYVMGPQRIHVENGSPFLSKHHINWRVKSLQRTEDLETEELMFTSPISISRSDFQALREGLIEFIQGASERVAKSPAEELACLNLDLFWIKK